tara:strand:+ start:952 stop:1638 length:687 start_codon:yes stop_codon:yes gene_type:complete
MKCVHFELTYLKSESNVWNNAQEFSTLLKNYNHKRTDTELPSWSINHHGDYDSNTAIFCFAEDKKINLLFFYNGFSWDLDALNAIKYFTFFHEYDLICKQSDPALSEVKFRSRKVVNYTTLYKRLYSVLYATYNPVEYIDQDDKSIMNDITFSNLSDVDSTYDSIENMYAMVCNCHAYADINDVHHCFNIDDKKNWNIIESYVKTFLQDATNVSDWHTDDTFVLENDA